MTASFYAISSRDDSANAQWLGGMYRLPYKTDFDYSHSPERHIGWYR